MAENREVLLPMLGSWINACIGDSDSRFMICTPIELLVESADPEFLVRDKIHNVACEFTYQSITNFKKNFPMMGIKDLKNKVVAICRYTPVLVSNKKEIYKKSKSKRREYRIILLVYDFTIPQLCPRLTYHRKSLYLSEDSAVTLDLNSLMKRSMRSSISQEALKLKLPLEDIVSGKEFKIETKMVYECEVCSQADLQQEIINYENIDIIEKQACLDAEKELKKAKIDRDNTRYAFRHKKRMLMQKRNSSLDMIAKLSKNIRIHRSSSAKRSISRKNSSVHQVSLNSKRRSSAAKNADTHIKNPSLRSKRINEEDIRKMQQWKEHSGAAPVRQPNSLEMQTNLKINFHSPRHPAKAFSSWVSATSPSRKRGFPESRSVRASVSKLSKF